MSEKNNYIFLTISNQKKKLIGKISQSDKTLIQPKKKRILCCKYSSNHHLVSQSAVSSLLPGKPKAAKSNNKSRSCPWISPKIRHGTFASAKTGWLASNLAPALAKIISVSMYSEVKSSAKAPPSVRQSEWYISSVSSTTYAVKLAAAVTTRRARPSIRRHTRLFCSKRACWVRMTYILLIVVKVNTREKINLPEMTPHFVMISTWFRAAVLGVNALSFSGGARGVGGPFAPGRWCLTSSITRQTSAFLDNGS